MDTFKIERYTRDELNQKNTNNDGMGWIWMTESTFLKCRTEPIIYYDLCLLAGEYRDPDKRHGIVPNVICARVDAIKTEKHHRPNGSWWKFIYVDCIHAAFKPLTIVED